MKTKIAILSIALTMLYAFPSVAQTLMPTDIIPVADASVGTAEYSYKIEQNGMVFSLSLSADGTVLYVALDAPASGWVAVGLGSRKMNGAFMVLGYDDKGATAISEETGKGHRHTANDRQILTSQAVKEQNGHTVLEFSVPVAPYIKDGKIDALFAWSKRDKFSAMHSKYAATTVPVATP